MTMIYFLEKYFVSFNQKINLLTQLYTVAWLQITVMMVLVERWNKEYQKDGKRFIPLLRCVSVDSFEEPCFIVEDKPGLMESYGKDPDDINNGVTLVKPREKAWPQAFFENIKFKK